MAIHKSGVMGAFSGSIASIQGYSRFGKSIIRAKRTKSNFNGDNRFATQNIYTANLAKNLNHYRAGIEACLAQDGIEFDLNWELILKGNLPFLNAFNKKYIIRCDLPFSQQEKYSTTQSVLNTGLNRITMTSTNCLKLKITGWLTHRRIMIWNYNTGFTTNNYAEITGNIGSQINNGNTLANNNYQVVMILFTNPLFPERYQATFNVVSKQAY